MSNSADAHPTKRFFVEMITRDISAIDAMLDLVDNSIDAIFRQVPTDIEDFIIGSTLEGVDASAKNAKFLISIEINERQIVISDNCGGISLQDAETRVFRFGRVIDSEKSSLSVYGIGMKRAIFKLGGKISITSRTMISGFDMNIDVRDWESRPDDWTFPLRQIDPATDASLAGTVIKITRLHNDIVSQIAGANIAAELFRSMQRAYVYFLNAHVNIVVNERRVAPLMIPIGASDDITPSRVFRQVGDIRAHIFVGLTTKDERRAETAGWYIFCNGRLIVYADKTSLTEWGTGALPQFHPKFRGFLGLLFFFSADPEDLPWTTTKRGLNRDSTAFLAIREDMRQQARPVLSFLNSLYPGEENESLPERELADAVKSVPKLSAVPISNLFYVRPARAARPSTVRVQYDATEEELARTRRAIRKPNWPATRIGRYALEYLLKNESDD